MRGGEFMRRYTAESPKRCTAAAEDRTDWAKVDATTEADLERAIAEDEDEDERDLDPDWTRAEPVISRPKGPYSAQSLMGSPSERASSCASRGVSQLGGM